MTATSSSGIAYQVVRSERSTADIIIERDGSVVVRAPAWADDAAVETIVESRAYLRWSTRDPAETPDTPPGAAAGPGSTTTAICTVTPSWDPMHRSGEAWSIFLRGGPSAA